MRVEISLVHYSFELAEIRSSDRRDFHVRSSYQRSTRCLRIIELACFNCNQISHPGLVISKLSSLSLSLCFLLLAPHLMINAGREEGNGRISATQTREDRSVRRSHRRNAIGSDLFSRPSGLSFFLWRSMRFDRSSSFLSPHSMIFSSFFSFLSCLVVSLRFSLSLSLSLYMSSNDSGNCGKTRGGDSPN